MATAQMLPERRDRRLADLCQRLARMPRGVVVPALEDAQEGLDARRSDSPERIARVSSEARSSVLKNGGRPPATTFKVVDERGKVVAGGTFRYG